VIIRESLNLLTSLFICDRIMQCVYENDARKLARSEMGHVLVMDLNTIARGLEVPKYYYCCFCHGGGLVFRDYSALLSFGLHMLYTKEGENTDIGIIVRLKMPELYPKTWKYILSKLKKRENHKGLIPERYVINRLVAGFYEISNHSRLVEKTGIGKYRIPKDVRESRFIPRCLPEELQLERIGEFEAMEWMFDYNGLDLTEKLLLVA